MFTNKSSKEDRYVAVSESMEGGTLITGINASETDFDPANIDPPASKTGAAPDSMTDSQIRSLQDSQTFVKSISDKQARGEAIGSTDIKQIFDIIKEKANDLEEKQIKGAFSPSFDENLIEISPILSCTDTLCLTLDNNLAFYDSKARVIATYGVPAEKIVQSAKVDNLRKVQHGEGGQVTRLVSGL